MQESSGQYITAFTTWIDGCGNATLNCYPYVSSAGGFTQRNSCGNAADVHVSVGNSGPTGKFRSQYVPFDKKEIRIPIQANVKCGTLFMSARPSVARTCPHPS
ncbi:hypothetical protein DFH06DRAFT_1292113 [Mycena polygramma]|nr:hypothetical protein DFH06DRAFT_1292113 [Mycena polygramma]